jgi:hypothetical protein
LRAVRAQALFKRGLDLGRRRLALEHDVAAGDVGFDVGEACIGTCSAQLGHWRRGYSPDIHGTKERDIFHD